MTIINRAFTIYEAKLKRMKFKNNSLLNSSNDVNNKLPVY